MKELSIEEKAKAYDEALERARKELQICGSSDCDAAKQIFRIFPELKEESEDERIRKEIIAFLHSKNGYMTPNEDWDFHNRWIAWLEKQGEQKYADKVEPKFKVGDWVVSDDKDVHDDYRVCKITKIADGRYYIEGGDFLSESSLALYEYRLWTIQDAKDGDVLVSPYNKPFIYNENYDSILIGAYCGISVEDNFIVTTEKCRWTENVSIYPATKEQRDILFKKMKEAGYEWDADKKELKKVEQKPA